LVTKDEILVIALATVSAAISSRGWLLKYYASVKPFLVFLGAISDFNAGFPQWHSLAETLIKGGFSRSYCCYNGNLLCHENDK